MLCEFTVYLITTIRIINSFSGLKGKWGEFVRSESKTVSLTRLLRSRGTTKFQLSIFSGSKRNKDESVSPRWVSRLLVTSIRLICNVTRSNLEVITCCHASAGQ